MAERVDLGVHIDVNVLGLHQDMIIITNLYPLAVCAQDRVLLPTIKDVALFRVVLLLFKKQMCYILLLFFLYSFILKKDKKSIE